jgi:hypothetical protein
VLSARADLHDVRAISGSEFQAVLGEDHTSRSSRSGDSFERGGRPRRPRGTTRGAGTDIHRHGSWRWADQRRHHRRRPCRRRASPGYRFGRLQKTVRCARALSALCDEHDPVRYGVTAERDASDPAVRDRRERQSRCRRADLDLDTKRLRGEWDGCQSVGTDRSVARNARWPATAARSRSWPVGSHARDVDCAGRSSDLRGSTRHTRADRPPWFDGSLPLHHNRRLRSIRIPSSSRIVSNRPSRLPRIQSR